MKTLVMLAWMFNSFLASGNFCCLLITITNCLDPDQDPDQQNVGPDLVPKLVSEYDQAIPQSQTADNPMAPRGRAAQPP